MKKSAVTKNILNEWRKFENRNLNESQGAAVRLKPKPSQRARELLKKLESKFGVGGFNDYSMFDNHDDYEMIDPDDGYQHAFQEVADFVNSSGEFDISDMTLGDFVISEDDSLLDIGTSGYELGIVKSGSFNTSNGEYYEFGYVELDDGERIPCIYHDSHGYTLYKFIPVEYDSQDEETSTFSGQLGSAWG